MLFPVAILKVEFWEFHSQFEFYLLKVNTIYFILPQMTTETAGSQRFSKEKWLMELVLYMEWYILSINFAIISWYVDKYLDIKYLWQYRSVKSAINDHFRAS